MNRGGIRNEIRCNAWRFPVLKIKKKRKREVLAVSQEKMCLRRSSFSLPFLATN